MAPEKKSRKGIGGPKTKEGKERVRYNALKTAMHTVSLEGMQAVADAIDVDFEEIHEQMRSYYRPKDFLEEVLVRRIARCTWRLQVIETMEDHRLTTLKLDSAPGKSLEEFSIIERRTDTQLHRNIQALAAKRKEDRRKRENELNALPLPGQWPRPEPEPENIEGQIPAEQKPAAQTFGGPDGISARTSDHDGHECPPNARPARDVQDDPGSPTCNL